MDKQSSSNQQKISLAELKKEQLEEVITNLKDRKIDDTTANLLIEILKIVLKATSYLSSTKTTIKMIKKLFGFKSPEHPDPNPPSSPNDTENTDSTTDQQDNQHDGSPNDYTTTSGSGRRKNKKHRNNGGRYGYDDYSGPIIEHEPEGASAGDKCEACGRGKYYYTEPQKQISYVGQPSLQVEKHLSKVLRCNCCGQTKICNNKIIKWTDSARAMIIINKVLGSTWYRQERIQKMVGVPVAQTTLWTQFLSAWDDCGRPVFGELYKVAAEGRIWQTDDANARILDVIVNNNKLPEDERESCYTTTICSICTDHDNNSVESVERKIIIYKIGVNNCRSNWTEMLRQRQSNDKLILMTDASSASIAKGKELERVMQALCLGMHAREKFKEIEKYYPDDCKIFLDLISELYVNEAAVKELRMNDAERLAYHKEYSQSIIDKIYKYIDQKYDKDVEPNCDLGKAMKYWLNHKEGLTAFLRVEGAPIDNNEAENSLRMGVMQRKVSLFYKSEFSATVHAGWNSIVATCEANGVNPNEYILWILSNWVDVQRNPQRYLPWSLPTRDLASNEHVPKVAA